MEDDILKPIDAMEDDELIAVITTKKENFNDDYRGKVQEELNKRGVVLEKIFQAVDYKINLQDFEKTDLSSAYEKLSEVKEPLDVIYYRNYMQELMGVQKTEENYVLHHFHPQNGFNSFFVKDEKTLQDSLNEFFTLGKWLPDEVEIIKHWDTFAESGSSPYILRLAKMLDKIGVKYSLNSGMLVRFTSYNAPYSLVLPVEQMNEAEGIWNEIEELKETLHKQMEEADEKEDFELQLEILTELESVTPDDSAVFYNRAQLLDEKGRHQEACDAFIESFNIDMAKSEVEDMEDVENYLVENLDKVEDKKNILHCLATIASFRADFENVFNHYSAILEQDANDPIAHLNLGHYYYSHTEEDEKVKNHFSKYIELEPESPERESIEEIINNLS